MAKKEEAAPQSVVLTCVYTGLEQSWNPGDVIELDAEEAERLLSLGAAKAVELSAEPAAE
jgi:hypothetical protein